MRNDFIDVPNFKRFHIHFIFVELIIRTRLVLVTH